LLDLLKGRVGLLLPLEGLALEYFDHGSNYGAKIAHKHPIKRGQNMKTLDMMHRCRSTSLPNGLYLVFIHMDPLGRNYTPKEHEVGCERVAFLEVSIELFLS